MERAHFKFHRERGRITKAWERRCRPLISPKLPTFAPAGELLMVMGFDDNNTVGLSLESQHPKFPRLVLKRAASG
jgi:hypothetical protein